MKKNEIINLKITDISSDGNGVGKHEGMAVFVPETCIEDIIEAKIVKVLKSYAYGIISKILSPSPYRIQSNCPVFPKCGGCSLRHISYNCELKVKDNIVKSCFKRIGKLEPEFEDILGCEETEGYRNKAQYPVADSGGQAVCGFYAKRSHRIIPYIPCGLLPEEFHKITEFIIDYINKNNIKGYNEIEHKGLLRHIYLRKGFSTGEIMVCLIVTRKSEKLTPLANQIAKKFKDVKSVVMNINPDRTNVILGKKTSVLFGKGYITDVMCGNKIRLSPESFYQVNSVQAQKLYKIAEEYADFKGDEHLLDLYCGTGTIGLSMARSVKKLIGVEIISQAVKNAEENARENGICNAEFICSDAGKAAKLLAENGEKLDVIILDPPRKGCDNVTLDSVLKMRPKKIVMISCNPATAARDCKYLCDNGYVTVKARGVDLFPRTGHVETVVLLSREFASAKDHVYIDYEPDSDIEFPASATYTEIKSWIQKEYGLKVSSLYIAQVKQKHGIIEHECHNKPKSENSRQPKCPPEKEEAIEAALEHFKMI